MAYLNFAALQGSPIAGPANLLTVSGLSAPEWQVVTPAQPDRLPRVSVLAWHKGYAVPRHEIRAFHEAGFTPEQYETLLASISRGRAALNQGKRFQ